MERGIFHQIIRFLNRKLIRIYLEERKKIALTIIPRLMKFRFFFHQFLAVTVEMMLLFQFGQCISFTGVVNAALSGRFNQNETLQLTDEESSWFGSMVYACQPFGSMLSMITTGMRILMI